MVWNFITILKFHYSSFKFNLINITTIKLSYIFSGFHLSESEVLFVPKFWALRILLKLCPNLRGLLLPWWEESFSTNLQFFSWSISSLFAKILLCFGLVCSKRGWHLLPLLRRKYRLSRGRCPYIAGQNSFEQVVYLLISLQLLFINLLEILS